jgi:hypothetical protein
MYRRRRSDMSIRDIPREDDVARGSESPRRRPIMTYALWVVQGLLAIIFLLTG